MKRLLFAGLLAFLLSTPAAEAKSHSRSYSKRQQRKRFVPQPHAKKHHKQPHPVWGEPKHRSK
jgi:hypothetical protein